MAAVTTAVVHRKIAFRERRGESETLFPSPSPQVIPERIARHPYFLAALASGWVEGVVVHCDPVQEPDKPKRRGR